MLTTRPPKPLSVCLGQLHETWVTKCAIHSDFPMIILSVISIAQRFPNFFQVGTTFISQNVLWTTLLLSPFESKLFKILNYSV
jgi:hypothetical protein